MCEERTQIKGEGMRYDKLRYGKDLQKLLNCYHLAPDVLTNLCIELELKVQDLNTRWGKGYITDARYKETLQYIIEGLHERGLDTSRISIGDDRDSPAIKVSGKDWPYTDAGGEGVLVHSCLLPEGKG